MARPIPSPSARAAGILSIAVLALGVARDELAAQRAWPITLGVAVTRWDLGEDARSFEFGVEAGIARRVSERLALGIVLRQGLDLDHDQPGDIVECPAVTCAPLSSVDPGSSTALASEVRYATTPGRSGPYLVGGAGWRMFYGSGVRGIAHRMSARFGLGFEARLPRDALYLELLGERVFGAELLEGWIFGLTAGFTFR